MRLWPPLRKRQGHVSLDPHERLGAPWMHMVRYVQGSGEGDDGARPRAPRANCQDASRRAGHAMGHAMVLAAACRVFHLGAFSPRNASAL